MTSTQLDDRLHPYDWISPLQKVGVRIWEVYSALRLICVFIQDESD